MTKTYQTTFISPNTGNNLSFVEWHLSFTRKYPLFVGTRMMDGGLSYSLDHASEDYSMWYLHREGDERTTIREHFWGLGYGELAEIFRELGGEPGIVYPKDEGIQRLVDKWVLDADGPLIPLNQNARDEHIRVARVDALMALLQGEEDIIRVYKFGSCRETSVDPTTVSRLIQELLLGMQIGIGNINQPDRSFAGGLAITSGSNTGTYRICRVKSNGKLKDHDEYTETYTPRQIAEFLSINPGLFSGLKSYQCLYLSGPEIQ